MPDAQTSTDSQEQTKPPAEAASTASAAAAAPENKETKDEDGAKANDAESLRGVRKLTGGVRSRLTRNIWGDDGRRRDHIPDMPVWQVAVRVLQMVLAIATLVLTSYAIATVQKANGLRRITNWSGSEGYPFTWFAFSWTFVYLIWLGLAVTCIPIMYNCWVHLGIEILTLVFWLIATSLLASHADDLTAIDEYVEDLGPAYEQFYQEFLYEYARGFIVATFAATATATLNFLLFVVTVITFGRSLHNHRVKIDPKDDDKVVPAPASDEHKIVASPHMASSAMPPYPPWAVPYPGHYPPYSYYGPPYPPPSVSPNTPQDPDSAAAADPASQPQQQQHPHPYPPPGHPYMHPYYPPPPHAYLPHQPPPLPPGAEQQGEQASQHQPHGSSPTTAGPTPWPPQSPHFGPPGSVWPQHSYGMYQQQVPIPAQHTGQSQPGFGSPQFPMVAPAMPSKADLHGVTTPHPPPSSHTAVSYDRNAADRPAELNDGAPADEPQGPAELSNDPPERDPARPR